MQFDDLSEFVSGLEDLGELVRISVEVDPLLEIAEITDRVCRSVGGGKALFFENVRGTTIPVVTNLLGSERRTCLALRSETLDAAAERIARVMRPELPEGWLGSLKMLPQLAQITRLPPKVVKTGLSQQVVKVGRDVDLRELPIPQSRPAEAGPSMTSGQIFTTNPETGLRDVSLGILALQGKTSLSILWNPQEDGWRNYEAYRQQGRQMPVAVALGGDPALLIAASAPLPRDTDECLLAGFLRGSAVELVNARSIPLEVPAQAEIVIEGLIDMDRGPVQSGPVALPTGFYSDLDETPLMDVTAVTQRANPIFPAMIHGMPPSESLYVNRAVERLLLPVIQTFLPEIVDFHLPASGASRNLLFVRIRKEYPQQARKVMSALWGMN
ncbi:MAG: UbiD family decarboxylase, partial [Planctomycetes bacterium]|nr:UbiD family decarboxylase [Planctomycetota bacterium]